jgi:hypothetical protein
MWSNDWLARVLVDDDWYGWLLLIGTSVGSDGWYGEFIRSIEYLE